MSTIPCAIPEPPPRSFKTITLRALGWAGAGSATSLLITFARLFILSRLLTPTDFGVFAVSNSLVTFLGGLAQGLFAAALLQDRSGTRGNASASSGLTFAVLFGLACACLLLMFSSQLGAVYRIQNYSDAFAYLAPVIVLRCMAQVPWAVLQRELQFRSEFICNACSLLAGTVVAVMLAWHGMGFHALLIGLVAEAAIMALATLLLSWRHLHARPQARMALDLVRRFGGWYSVTYVSGLLNQNVQHFLVSLLHSPHALGLFSRTQSLHEAFAGSFFGTFINRLFRIFPMMEGHTERLRRAMEVCIEVVALVTLPVSAMLFFSADSVVRIVLGPAWMEAAHLFGIFALGLMARLCYKVTEFISYSVGRAFTTSVRSVVNLLATAVGIAVLSRFGLVAAVAAVVVAALVNYLMSASIAIRGVGSAWGAFALLHLRGFVLAAIVAAVFLGLQSHPVGGPIAQDLFACAASAAVLALGCWAFPGLLLGERVLDISPKLRRLVRQ